jgi:glycosyltransferase involved in cell wall biosynthesis
MPSKVTAVIPCYNHGRYLNQSIGSIKKQSYTDWEIIIVNDGSTDEYTNKLLKNYFDPKVKIITTKNQGLPTARNIGIKNSTSEYILTLDADDYFEQTFLEKAVKILNQEKEFGVVTCMIQSFGKNHNIWTPLGGDVKNFLVDNNCGASCLFRRQFWLDAGGYFEEFKSGYEDWDFWISGTEKGWKVYVLQ